nr:hypothetical protein [Bacteroidota bacterium]
MIIINTGLPNFNIGTSYRWKIEMTQKEIELCNSYLSEEILKMGYE